MHLLFERMNAFQVVCSFVLLGLVASRGVASTLIGNVTLTGAILGAKLRCEGLPGYFYF